VLDIPTTSAADRATRHDAALDAEITKALDEMVACRAAQVQVARTAGAVTAAELAGGRTAGAAARTAAAGGPKDGDVRGHRRILIVTYHVVSNCTVLANYPVNPGGRQWTIPAGRTINWRYNVTSRVAAVSDPAGHAKGFPWWGFVADSGCIGTSVGQTGSYQIFHNGRWETRTIRYPAGRPVPKRILSGRSQFPPYWRAVDWRPSHGAIPAAQRRMTHNATLRDAANRFVIGKPSTAGRSGRRPPAAAA
jgi:hypothetical protein